MTQPVAEVAEDATATVCGGSGLCGEGAADKADSRER